jgi:hypothetical protein
MEQLKHRHGMAAPPHLSGDRQPGRACTYDSNPLPGIGLDVHMAGFVLGLPIGAKALQAANGHRFEASGQRAHTLALILLRTDTAANSRERIVFLDYGDGLSKLTILHVFDESRDVDADRASLDARFMRAL